jgi:hypothetical protein
VNHHDVLVMAARRRARLGHESLNETGMMLGEQLERNPSAQAQIAGQIHLAHAAATELANQLVLADATAGTQHGSA